MTQILKFVLASLFSASVIFSLSACSDDKQATGNQPTTQSTVRKFDHAHGAEVTDLVKHEFEHDFAEQCVERELRNSINKEQDRQRFGKSCMCIATYMMKDLTAKEAEKFVKQHKNTQSLRIRFENAAFHCLQAQKKSQPRAPVIFNRG